MGGFFGAVSKNDTVLDVFFGTDYHSHLGTRRGGMAAYDEQKGALRISPFRGIWRGLPMVSILVNCVQKQVCNGKLTNIIL